MSGQRRLKKWKMVGEVLIPGVLNIGDIDKTNGCKKGCELAEKFNRSGKNE